MPPSNWDLYCGRSSVRVLQVPCGKCPECLEKRQDSIAARAVRAAEDAGSMHFLTLTYDPQYLPIAVSCWQANSETGEYSDCIMLPQIVHDPEANDILRSQVTDYFRTHKGCCVLEKYNDNFPDLVWRFTPSVAIRDVQLMIKRFRKKYAKECTSFKFMIVSEYGSPKYTARPHYHLLLFGISDFYAALLENEWPYGRTELDKVYQINEDDGSNGFEKVAAYIGKYCAKGKFDVYSKRHHYTLKDRLCTSKGLGLSNFDNLKRYHLAQDLFDYDPELFHKLPEDLKTKIVNAITSRLYWKFGKKKIALPATFVKFIFNGRTLQDKQVYSSVYYACKDFIRNMALQKREEEFKIFCSQFPAENLAYAVAAFNHNREASIKSRERIIENRILTFYNKHSKI